MEYDSFIEIENEHYYFKTKENIVLDVINISNNISESVEINKFVGLKYSETLCMTLSSMIRSELYRTCSFLKNKYGDEIGEK